MYVSINFDKARYVLFADIADITNFKLTLFQDKHSVEKKLIPFSQGTVKLPRFYRLDL